MVYEEIRRKTASLVLEEMDYTRQTSDGEVLDLIDEAVTKAGDTSGLALGDMKRMRTEIFYSLRRLDVLQDLLEDPEITEIMINGSQDIFVEKRGAIRQTDLHFSSPERYLDVIRKIVSDCNHVVNESSPIADARLPDGDRVNVVMPPVAIDGPVVTIRKFPKHPIRMQDLIRLGSVNEEIADFLGRLVEAGYNIFISGGTGSGKTTFLNALSDAIPQTERIITIEDNAELQIRSIPNLVRLEARVSAGEECSSVTIRDLIRSSLRMRPDRIIVGEVRGEEAIDLLQAYNTGHDGSMSTGHANNTRDMLSRLETMVLLGSVDLPVSAIRGQIAAGIDIMVHLGRLRDRSRRLLEISELNGMENGQILLRPLYRFQEEGMRDGRVEGNWIRENNLSHMEKADFRGVYIPRGPVTKGRGNSAGQASSGGSVLESPARGRTAE